MVTLRCLYASTTSFDLRRLYNFVIVCSFTNFKHRNTVARIHVVGHCAGAVRRFCDNHAITAIIGRPQGVMPCRLHLPYHCTIFRSAMFSLRYLDIAGDHGLRRMCSGFLRYSGSEPYDHREIVGKSQVLRTLKI